VETKGLAAGEGNVRLLDSTEAARGSVRTPSATLGGAGAPMVRCRHTQDAVPSTVCADNRRSVDSLAPLCDEYDSNPAADWR